MIFTSHGVLFFKQALRAEALPLQIWQCSVTISNYYYANYRFYELLIFNFKCFLNESCYSF